MMRLPLAAAVMLFIWSVAGATDLPETPDLPQAGSMLDALDSNTYRCEQTGGGVQCRRSGIGADRVEGKQAREIVLFYRNGMLVRSAVALDEDYFRALEQRLSVTLGPANRGDEALNAGMGGTFSNNYYIWRRDGRTWFLEQFFERIIYSGLWIMNDDEFDAMMIERGRHRVRGVRDL